MAVPESFEELAAGLRPYGAYIGSIEDTAAGCWHDPIAPGKWTIHEIVSHIWLWDTYSLEHMIPAMSEGAVLTFDNQASVNRNAEFFARRIRRTEMIDHARQTREELIERCAPVYASGVRFFVGPRRVEHDIGSYVRTFIAEHDRHHMQQIEAFLDSLAKSKTT
ncbi:DinB family protein [Paenibacillus ginsengarvi]|uniref:DinB-like domain-containing protein n=1 Tax=Paenibacillus ginsengarvi TaxID=400777 RepID=A0A3B0CMK4_9BACL|nr:hypothetical protein [Paenibacillus ginsengarvi]RKN85744.1 hypothetical protein D7M11_05220 [Paenibacillus ginsengarvi]